VVGPAQSLYDREQWREIVERNSDAPAGACYMMMMMFSSDEIYGGVYLIGFRGDRRPWLKRQVHSAMLITPTDAENKQLAYVFCTRPVA